MKDNSLIGIQYWYGTIFNVSTIEDGEMIINLKPDKRCLYHYCHQWADTMEAVFIHIKNEPAQQLLASISQTGDYIGVLGRQVNDSQLIERAFMRVGMTDFVGLFTEHWRITPYPHITPEEYFSNMDAMWLKTNSSTKKH